MRRKAVPKVGDWGLRGHDVPLTGAPRREVGKHRGGLQAASPGVSPSPDPPARLGAGNRARPWGDRPWRAAPACPINLILWSPRGPWGFEQKPGSANRGDFVSQPGLGFLPLSLHRANGLPRGFVTVISILAKRKCERSQRETEGSFSAERRQPPPMAHRPWPRPPAAAPLDPKGPRCWEGDAPALRSLRTPQGPHTEQWH